MWVNADKAGLKPGIVRLKWPDGFEALERLDLVFDRLCVLTSHRGVNFAAPLEGNAFMVDDGKEAPEITHLVPPTDDKQTPTPPETDAAESATQPPRVELRK
jgi:hypothetical protein